MYQATWRDSYNALIPNLICDKQGVEQKELVVEVVDVQEDEEEEKEEAQLP